MTCSVMKKKTILLAIETSRGFGRGLIKGIAQYALEQGNWSLLFQDRGMLDEPQHWLKTWKGDGIISRSATPKVWRYLQKLGIPIVELLGDEKEVFGEVVLDNVKIGRMAVRHLAERNYRHFAYFSPENWWYSLERRDGFLNAVTELGYQGIVFPVRESAGTTQRYSAPNICEIVTPRVIRWLKNLPKPVGLFVVSDLHAVYLIEACKRANIAVPEEIAILGMDNDQFFCETASPQLSSVDPNTPLMGYEAAKRLDNLLHGRPLLQTRIRIPPAFVATRQTTDIVAVNDPLVARILNHIRENADSLLSVNQLAREFGVSVRTMQRRFRETVYRTPEEEILRLRLDKAKTYLRNTKMSVSEIAHRLGFEDPSYFVRFFRLKCSLTPNQYRRLHPVALNVPDDPTIADDDL